MTTQTTATVPSTKKKHLKRVGIASAAVVTGCLLLGSGASMAGWSANTDIDAGTISTGSLTLDATAAGSWEDATPSAANTDFIPATDRLSPGDTVRYTQTVNIGAEGKNMKGVLTVGSFDSAVPAELADDVTVTVAASVTDPQLTVDGNTISFAEAGQYAIPVTITVAFAEGAEGSVGPSTMETVIDLTSLPLTLTQVN